MSRISVGLNEDATDPRRYRTFEVRGCPGELLLNLQQLGPKSADWCAFFRVFVEPAHEAASSSDRPIAMAMPMLGTYGVEGELIRFSPAYPLMEGQRYGAVFALGCAAGAETEVAVRASFAIPKSAAPRTQVTCIYPSAEVLPENLLRLYVHFSAPMREGEALRHIRLLDSDGNEVEAALLELAEELWDVARTRLTLLLDPGRVKTGLTAHNQLGRALRAGGAYQLVIDGAWRDAHGEPLVASACKRFTVAPAELSQPSLADWRLHAPPAGTRTPLRIALPRPLDQGLLMELLHVRSAQDAVVQGQVRVQQDETVWEFAPEEAWAAGAYAVQIDPRLEDPAGNNLEELFERPPKKGAAQPHTLLSLRFECGAAAALTDPSAGTPAPLAC